MEVFILGSSPSEPLADVEASERATLQAVDRQLSARLDDWLAPLDDGPIGRLRAWYRQFYSGTHAAS